jgi:lambda repressor-like predicted transcriptional regulator
MPNSGDFLIAKLILQHSEQIWDSRYGADNFQDAHK